MSILELKLALGFTLNDRPCIPCFFRNSPTETTGRWKIPEMEFIYVLNFPPIIGIFSESVVYSVSGVME